MFERIRNIALYGDVTKEEYETVKPKIVRTNRLAAMKFSVISTILIFSMYLASYVIEGLKSSRQVYVAGTLATLILVTMAMYSKRIALFTYIQIYSSTFVFFLYGIIIGTVTRPEEQAVTFMVLLILVPMLFTDRPLRMASNIIFYMIVFIIMCMKVKEEPVRSVDIVDAIIFGTLAIMATTIVYRAKIKGYLLETELHVFSETDQLTGLNNRNSYEWRIKAYPNSYGRSICCIYIDVNGLHEVNNNYGHKAGDEMLQYIADVIKKYFGDKHSYRIGGDEFVSFIFDMSITDIKSRVHIVEVTAAEENYHVAIGYEYSSEPSVNMDTLISGAEANMYKSKTEFYKERDRSARM
jgi:diguanylate cyclase (GGDEF)-like protein